MKFRIALLFFLFASWHGYAQTLLPVTNYFSNLNTITTAVPFLLITPDARAAGMGESGVASTPDVNSIHWNPAKLAFAEKKFAVGFSYTPWLRALIPDVNHVYGSFYLRLDSNSTIGTSFRYFSMGNISMTSATGTVIAQYRPYEYAFDICYSKKLSKYFSAGLTGRFIYSDLARGTMTGVHSGKVFAGDLGLYYYDKDRVRTLKNKCLMRAGIALTNVGSKMSYTNSDQGDFIPINLRIGQGVTLNLDAYNQIGFQYEFNKLLVPTPPQYALDSNGYPKTNPLTGEYVILAGKDPNVSVPRGMLQSFSDAPGGSSEELAEINFSAGLEYLYNKAFAIRTGYFYEAATKGNRQFLTLGAGVKFNVCTLDFAYLIPTNRQRSPMQNTLRFSLLFEFDKFPMKKNH